MAWLQIFYDVARLAILCHQEIFKSNYLHIPFIAIKAFICICSGAATAKREVIAATRQEPINNCRIYTTPDVVM